MGDNDRFLMSLIVEMLKNRVGRLRPDFLDRCKWDAVASASTGYAINISFSLYHV